MTTKRILIAIGVVVLLVVGWYLGSPLFLNREVHDAFPETSPIGGASDDVRPAAAPTQSPPAATTAVIHASGTFVGSDVLHRGAGTAALLTLPNRQQILRLSSFSVTNGPDLRVYLSAHAGPRTAAEFASTGSLELAPLKGNRGDQNYTIPSGTDLTKFQSVVIYCKPFHVVFAVASLNR